MKKLVFCALLAGGVLAACSNNPGAPSVSFTAPVAAGPSNGSSYKFKSQPVTVSITNTVRTAPAATAYSVEVATDPNFTSKVLTRDDIAEGSGGTTSVELPGLAATDADVTYYWRWWAVVDGVAGPVSATQSFVVQQQIIVNPPALGAPDNGETTSESRPVFRITNATRQGAVGTITYLFQVSKVSNFSSIEAQEWVTEQGGGQTSWTPDDDLEGATYFWRVQARDAANDETSSFSSTRSFVLEPFDPTKAIFYYTFPDVGFWDETAKITSVLFRDYLLVDFDRRDGPNPWPEVSSGSFGPLQYTLGLCYNIDRQWHCSAPVQFWAGRELEAAGPVDLIPENWFYDPARWGPMSGYVPEYGETVAVWAGQGNLRGGSGNTQAQRTNFALVRWGIDYHAD